MLRLAAPLFAAMLALPACIIVTDDSEDETGAGETGGAAADESGEGGAALACGDPETFSTFDDAGNCVCEEGLLWCTENEDDFTCCLPGCGDPETNSEPVGDDQCQCLPGFDWCTDDPDDINCCEI